MWSHKEPDFALHMLCELQKQQQCSLHCDILLQTDGISIPAHSCVLSAVSPVFSRAFASSPSVPLGQSRLVSLQTVRARALLKLVGFMYSGEMEGEGLDEQQEVFDVAHMLGFTYLTDGKKKLSDRQQEDIMTWRTIGLHRERRKKDASVQILSDKKIFMHLGTQTGGPGAETDLVSETLPNKMKVVTGGSDSISTPAGFDCDNNNVSSPSNISEALVRVQTKHQQIQPEKKHVKMPDMGGTQISLKIKLKRQMSGALWEIVSVHEENTTNGSKACDSASERCDADQRMTNNHTEVSALHRESSTLTQTHRNCPEIHLSPSPTFTAQNLGTVTLTPPSDLTASSPFRPLSEHSFLCTPHPILLSPPLQMSPPPVSPDLAQPEESDEQIVRLLEDMDMMGLSILPSVSMERIGDLHHLSPVCSHLDQKIDACEVAVDAPNRNLSVYGDDQGINASNGNETSSGSSGQEKTGSECSAFENLDLCTTVELQNDASISSSASLAVTSPFIRQDKNHETLPKENDVWKGL
ncbi:uncharacterized protein LOC134315315 [Trichomycterus rosablanca]|uniref:uncharacterized protein LOC134315315 n=1 Tax=Trichomycterus rosablanca TaxID=2290929 RepID=UPI002F35763C